MTIRTVVETTITAFAPQDWDRCFSGELENWQFYRVCEQAGPPGFSWYFAAVMENDHPLAVVPAFGTLYRLDTTLQGAWKRVTERLHRLLPALLSLRLLALGSPVAEICHLGFAPEVPHERRADLLDRMVRTLRAFGLRHGYRLFGVKDAPTTEDEIWTSTMDAHGFTRLPGLPTAVLDLPFRKFEDYLTSLSRATRKDMRRKMKAFKDIHVEARHDIGDVADKVAALYDETVAHSNLQFEYLPKNYFSDLVRCLAPRTSIFLYWQDDHLIAFNLVIQDEHRLIDKYIGMHYALVRKYNLYFNTWLCNVRYCIERGIPVYQSGQAFYGPKVRLGCRLLPNWQYFRHANPLINRVLLVAARFVRLDRFDPAIIDTVENRLDSSRVDQACPSPQCRRRLDRPLGVREPGPARAESRWRSPRRSGFWPALAPGCDRRALGTARNRRLSGLVRRLDGDPRPGAAQLRLPAHRRDHDRRHLGLLYRLRRNDQCDTQRRYRVDHPRRGGDRLERSLKPAASLNAWWAPSIRWQMVGAFIAISVVPMLIATDIATQLVETTFQTDVEAWLSQTAGLFVADIVDDQRDTNDVAETLFEDGSLDRLLSGSTNSLPPSLKRIIELLDYEILAIFDDTDKIVFTSKPNITLVNVPFTDGQTIFLYEDSNKSALLAAGIRQVIFHGRFYRIVLGSLIDQSFISNIGSVTSLAIRLYYKINGRFTKVYSSRDSEPIIVSPMIIDDLQSKNYDGDYLPAKSTRGDNSIGVYVPLRADGQLIGIVFCGLSSDAGLAGLLTRRNLFLGIFLIGMLLSILGGLIMARLVTRPVIRLADGVNAIAKGDFDQRVPVRHQDELGQLAQAFNSMARQLQDLRKLEVKLRRSERMATLGEVAAGLAHEVRNPLGIIKTSAELLERSPNLTEIELRRLGYVVDEVRRIDQLIRDFLTFAKPPQKLVTIKAIELVDRVLGICQGEIERQRVRVFVTDESGDTTIGVDVDQMVQACLNLVLNALQAMENVADPLRRVLDIQLHVEEDEVHLSFADSGPGIPPQLLPRIFDPFVTTKDTGTGLGLAQVFAIAESHGGWTEARNAAGQGAVFELVIPRHQARAGDVPYDPDR